MPAKNKRDIIVAAEFEAQDLGVPFKVVLFNSVRQVINTDTGEVEKIIIPNIRGLMQKIAMTRIAIPQKLSGSEVKFIRRAFKLKASQLSEKIGVTAEHFSRCESGERVLSPGAEKCLRISALLEHYKLPDNVDDLISGNEEAKEKIELFYRALFNVQNIMNEMHIVPAFNANETLCLGFKIADDSGKDLFDEDPDADWLDKEPICLAA